MEVGVPVTHVNRENYDEDARRIEAVPLLECTMGGSLPQEEAVKHLERLENEKRLYGGQWVARSIDDHWRILASADQEMDLISALTNKGVIPTDYVVDKVFVRRDFKFPQKISE